MCVRHFNKRRKIQARTKHTQFWKQSCVRISKNSINISSSISSIAKSGSETCMHACNRRVSDSLQNFIHSTENINEKLFVHKVYCISLFRLTMPNNHYTLFSEICGKSCWNFNHHGTRNRFQTQTKIENIMTKYARWMLRTTTNLLNLFCAVLFF